VKLPRVGHPLIDQDQARAVLLEQLAQRIARARRLLIVRLNPRERLLAPKLPGQLAPQRPDNGAVRLDGRIARRDLVADQDHPPGARERRGISRLHHHVDSWQVTGRDAGEEMIERQHRVRLAAAEVRLELHDRVAALAGQTPNRSGEHGLQALRQVGAAEELDRILVFRGALAEMHLPEIGRKLGLLIETAGDIPVRRHDLAPGLQQAGRRALDRDAGRLALLTAHLLVEAQAQQFHLDSLDLVGLRRRHGGQQPSGRIQRPIRVVARERLLVRPLVPMVAEFREEAPFGGT
jgi:hypothetical protein